MLGFPPSSSLPSRSDSRLVNLSPLVWFPLGDSHQCFVVFGDGEAAKFHVLRLNLPQPAWMRLAAIFCSCPVLISLLEKMGAGRWEPLHFGWCCTQRCYLSAVNSTSARSTLLEAAQIQACRSNPGICKEETCTQSPVQPSHQKGGYQFP